MGSVTEHTPAWLGLLVVGRKIRARGARVRHDDSISRHQGVKRRHNALRPDRVTIVLRQQLELGKLMLSGISNNLLAIAVRLLLFHLCNLVKRRQRKAHIRHHGDLGRVSRRNYHRVAVDLDYFDARCG